MTSTLSLMTSEPNNFTESLVGNPLVCLFTQEISDLANIISIFIGFTIIVGNILVLLVIYRYPANRFTPLNWLLCHLAVADLAIGLTVFFWYGVAEILQLPIHSMLKVVLYGLSIVMVIASMEGLMMIAIDRYFLIVKHTRYTKVLTKLRLKIAIVISWIIPAVLEIVAPLSGWSCVVLCDCRIHNLRPDDKYCFGATCSQMLPPLTKLQLFLTSAYVIPLLGITIVLYCAIFYSVRKKANRLQASLRASHTPSPTSPNSSGSRKDFTTNLKWRNNLEVIHEPSNERSEVRFSTFNKQVALPIENAQNDEVVLENDEVVLENDEVILNNNQQINMDKLNNHVNGSNSSSPDKINLPVFDVPRIQTAVICHNKSLASPIRTAELPGQVPSHVITKYPTITLRPPKRRKSLSESSTSSKRGSSYRKAVTSMAIMIRRITPTRSKRRTSAARKRDVRVMTSMCIIMGIFVVTTFPLIFFSLYTFFDNDRSLKEIFNILLQVTTLNSLLNPFLYFWRIPAMRTKLKKLVKYDHWVSKWWTWRSSNKVLIEDKMKKTPKPELSDSWESVQSE